MLTETQVSWNGHSMVGTLKRVLVCSPDRAGWNSPACAALWQELGFHHAVKVREAAAQHAALCRQLETAGADLVSLPAYPDLSLDAVYAHDASLSTDFGMIILRPGKTNRVAESARHREFYENIGIPVLGEITSPGAVEAGDMIWLNSGTLLTGRGYRTNAAGIQQMRELLAPKGVEVLAAPLPHGPGPSACLHLMSLISLIDENTALVDMPRLAVETLELLHEHGYTLIEIEPQERETLACNVLALGNRQLLGIEENLRTNDRLRQAGFDVRTFPGNELCINGSGGPTCLTRPLLRL
ncbi:MAG TPA: arginine deiminase family protein [Terriglobales bacterium]|nr:arginine deiminase family protein [Terriglobales bacterium]